MTAARHAFPAIPDTVAHLDPDVVVETLSRHAVNVSDAAAELGVASADLRRLLWARPHLSAAAAEIEERRLDLAEKNVYEALHSDNPRMRFAASMFTIRNSIKARRRGWITSSAGVDMSLTVNQPGEVVYRWRDKPVDPEFDAENARLIEEGKRVVTIGWGDPDDKTDFIERDGKRIPVPRYGRADDCLEGEVAPSPPMIGHASGVASGPELKSEPVASSPSESARAAPDPAVHRERERIDAWIRNRLIDFPLASCLRCRTPIVVGAAWEEVSNGEARARFHRACYAEWRAEREAAARQALGLVG